MGSTVRYECDEGFWAENTTLLSAVCLEEGTWSNAARPPRCLREPLFPFSISMPARLTSPHLIDAASLNSNLSISEWCTAGRVIDQND